MRRPAGMLEAVVDGTAVETNTQPSPAIVQRRRLGIVVLLSLLLAATLVRGLAAEHSTGPPAGAPDVKREGLLHPLERPGPLNVGFGRAGVTVRSGSARLGVRLNAVGWGTSLRAVGYATPRAHGKLMSYAHDGLSEWYVNGPLGLEQGFTVRHIASGPRTQPLTLAVGLSGGARSSLAPGAQTVKLERSGAPALLYGQLVASDARGNTLHSWLELRPGAILLRVDARGARFPIRIDPLIRPGEKFSAGSSAFTGLFGSTIAMSADGNTAVISSPGSAGIAGGAWVFTRSGSTWIQQGGKLVGSEEVASESESCITEAGEEAGECRLARSIAISADGDTVLIGSPHQNGSTGAAWVFTRSGSEWEQQGGKLTGGQENPKGRFGKSVALSADGNTALIGGTLDRGGKGSAWVFTRSGATWEQQTKLTPAGEEGEGHFGVSVALSADGNTALVGGPGDSAYAGAVWPFMRTDASWTQQGSKLTGGEESGAGHFGVSVALAADGNTALVGARHDGEGLGAAWAFTRTESTWAQQGPKITGAGDESGAGELGYSVSLSPGGNKALIGAPRDNSSAGAAWELDRSGSTWEQQGPKILGSEEIGPARFGASVALATAASYALIGGPYDSDKVGAVWTFTGSTLTAPRVNHITPRSGPTAGGTAVTIRGSGFLPGAAVTIGDVATAVQVLSENEIAATTAAGEPGAREVVVSDENGTSSGGPKYTYVAPPPPPPLPPPHENGPTGASPQNNPITGSSGILATVTVALPSPVLAVTGNLAPVSGQVFVKLPGSAVFVALTGLRQVPFGTIIDARRGRVTVTTVDRNGHLQVITFYEGEFIMTQTRSGQVTAALFGGNFSVCPTARERLHLARASSSHASRKHVVRKLWGEGHGHYSTKGNYAAGAVLGTVWLTEDLCGGTLIRVRRDRVLVTNLVNHRHTTVKAGHSYLVKAPG
jgi:hypothetical protein